jgi:hypothetical protein
MIPLLALSVFLATGTIKSATIVIDNVILSSERDFNCSIDDTSAISVRPCYPHQKVTIEKRGESRSPKYEKVIQKVLYGLWCGFLARIALGIFEDSAIDPATKLYLAGFFGVLSGTIYE